MSFEVFWEALDDGLAKKLQDFLNERLARVVEKPAFLGAIQIEGLNFGNVPPNVTVVDFTQPRLEFYVRPFRCVCFLSQKWRHSRAIRHRRARLI